MDYILIFEAKENFDWTYKLAIKKDFTFKLDFHLIN